MKLETFPQFSVRTLVVEVTAYAAFCCAWCFVWFREQLATPGYYPEVIGLISIAMLLWGAWQSRREEQSEFVWSFIVIATHLTGINIVYKFGKILIQAGTFCHGFPREWLQESFQWAIVSSVTLPVFIALPLAFFLLVHRRQSPGRKLLFSFLAGLVATVSFVLFVMFVVEKI